MNQTMRKKLCLICSPTVSLVWPGRKKELFAEIMHSIFSKTLNCWSALVLVFVLVAPACADSMFRITVADSGGCQLRSSVLEPDLVL